MVTKRKFVKFDNFVKSPEWFRITAAGLDPKLFSARGLSSGYLTETARRGIRMAEAMQQSQHRSVNQASRYYNDAEWKLGHAARLLG